MLSIGRVQFGSQRNVSNSIISKLQRVVLLRVNRIVHEVCLGVQINS